MAKKIIFPKENIVEETINKLYFDSLEKVQETEEYKENEKKIELYKNILKNNYHVNPTLVEEFVSLVEGRIELEYENTIETLKKKL